MLFEYFKNKEIQSKLKEDKILIMKKAKKDWSWISIFIPINIVLLSSWFTITIILKLDPHDTTKIITGFNYFYQAILLFFALFTFLKYLEYTESKDKLKSLKKEEVNSKNFTKNCETINLNNIYEEIKEMKLVILNLQKLN